MSQTLFATTLRSEDDLVAVRAQLRRLVDAVGFGTQDQVRITTAVSNLLTAGLRHGRSTLELSIGRGEEVEAQVLRAVVGQLPGQLFGAAAMPAAVGTTQRDRRRTEELVSAVAEVERIVRRVRPEPDRLAIVLEQPLPATVPMTPDRVQSIVEEATRSHPGNPFEEIQQQNRELVTALRELQATTIALQDSERGVTALTAEVGDRASALQEANVANRTVLQTLAHEVRGPLYAIRALVDSMEPPFAAEPTTQDLAQIDLATVEALRLVDLQLETSRARVHGLVPRYEDVEIPALLSAVRGMTAPLCRPGVELLVEHADGPATLRTDAHLLAQALRNLVGNALKFTDAGEVQVVCVSDPPGTVSFLVSDTGIGISAEDLPRVFGDFEIVEGDRIGRLPGSGLGLPFVRSVAQALGGRVTATSVLGSGSTFRLELPERPPA